MSSSGAPSVQALLNRFQAGTGDDTANNKATATIRPSPQSTSQQTQQQQRPPVLPSKKAADTAASNTSHSSSSSFVTSPPARALSPPPSFSAHSSVGLAASLRMMRENYQQQQTANSNTTTNTTISAAAHNNFKSNTAALTAANTDTAAKPAIKTSSSFNTANSAATTTTTNSSYSSYSSSSSASSSSSTSTSSSPFSQASLRPAFASSAPSSASSVPVVAAAASSSSPSSSSVSTTFSSSSSSSSSYVSSLNASIAVPPASASASTSLPSRSVPPPPPRPLPPPTPSSIAAAAGSSATAATSSALPPPTPPPPPPPPSSSSLASSRIATTASAQQQTTMPPPPPPSVQATATSSTAHAKTNVPPPLPTTYADARNATNAATQSSTNAPPPPAAAVATTSTVTATTPLPTASSSSSPSRPLPPPPPPYPAVASIVLPSRSVPPPPPPPSVTASTSSAAASSSSSSASPSSSSSSSTTTPSKRGHRPSFISPSNVPLLISPLLTESTLPLDSSSLSPPDSLVPLLPHRLRPSRSSISMEGGGGVHTPTVPVPAQTNKINNQQQQPPPPPPRTNNGNNNNNTHADNTHASGEKQHTNTTLTPWPASPASPPSARGVEMSASYTAAFSLATSSSSSFSPSSTPSSSLTSSSSPSSLLVSSPFSSSASAAAPPAPLSRSVRLTIFRTRTARTRTLLSLDEESFAQKHPDYQFKEPTIEEEDSEEDEQAHETEEGEGSHDSSADKEKDKEKELKRRKAAWVEWYSCFQEKHARSWKETIGWFNPLVDPYGELFRSEKLMSKKLGKALIKSGGIPPSCRGLIWEILLGARRMRMQNTEYYPALLVQLLEHPTRSTRDIEKDVARTMHGHAAYEEIDGAGQGAMKRGLCAFSFRYPLIGYAQSMSTLFATILLHYINEEHAFWVFERLLISVLPADYYTPSLIGIRTDCLILKKLLAKRCSKLHHHLHRHQVDLDMLTLPWLMCLFVHVVPLETAMRLWDVLMYKGSHVLLSVCVALLARHDEELCALGSMGELVTRMQCMGKGEYDCEALLGAALGKYHVRAVDAAKMREETRPILEKEYVANIRFKQ